MASPATDLAGTFHQPDGTPVNGKLIFLLSQPARLADNSAQVVPMVKIFAVSNGQLEAGAFIYGNDVLVPQGTYYLVRLVDTSNNLLFEQKWSIQGTTLDLGTLTPTTTGVVLPDPLVKNVTTDQTVQGPVTFGSGITASSLVVQGNVHPSAEAAFDLGNNNAAWREIHARRWGGLTQPSLFNGQVPAPTSAPSVTNSATGGTIPAGTYHIKATCVTITNAAGTTFGETTASPSQSVVTTGATSRLQVGTGAQCYAGAVGYYTYASNDNVNFFRQTLDPVGGNQTCQLDTQVHKINCSSGAVLTSLVFSGTQPPASNTTVISPLQVALNSVKDFAANTTSGMVLVNTPLTVTTPIVLSSGHRLECTSVMNAQGTFTGRITSAIANPKLATVMITGTGTVEGCDVLNTGTGGNAVLLQNAVSGGQSVRIANGSLRANSTNNTGAALKIQGIWYDLVFTNLYMRGDKACVFSTGVSGSNWKFTGPPRCDIGGDHTWFNESAVTDPDLNVNFGAFPNGVSSVVWDDVLIENGDREIFHVVNASFEVRGGQIADPTNVGTAVFRIGRDANSGNATFGNIAVRDLQIQFSANTSLFFLQEMGGTGSGMGFVTAANIPAGTSAIPAVDYNNVTACPQFMFLNTDARPYSGATGKHFINKPPQCHPITFGGINDLDESKRGMNSIRGSLIFGDNNPSFNTRTFHWPSADLFAWYRGDIATTANLWLDWSSAAIRFLDSTGAAPLAQFNRTNNTVGFGRTGPVAGLAPGRIGLPNNVDIVSRNAANSNECVVTKVNTSDQVELGGATICFPHFPRTGANAPFTVAGTGVVTNLNADLLDGLTSGNASGNIPISNGTVSTNLNADLWDGKHGLDFSAALDFASIAAQTCAELTITATGAAANSPVAASWPAAIEAGLAGMMRVSATNTITVRLCNITGSAIDPASQTFAGRTIQ